MRKKQSILNAKYIKWRHKASPCKRQPGLHGNWVARSLGHPSWTYIGGFLLNLKWKSMDTTEGWLVGEHKKNHLNIMAWFGQFFMYFGHCFYSFKHTFHSISEFDAMQPRFLCVFLCGPKVFNSVFMVNWGILFFHFFSSIKFMGWFVSNILLEIIYYTFFISLEFPAQYFFTSIEFN